MKSDSARAQPGCEARLAARERELAGLASLTLTAAHEMRAPLQTIYGFASLLGPDLASAEFDHYLASIQQDADRLMAMLDDLSWRVRLESGALQVKLEACDVEPILIALAREVERDYRNRYVVMRYAELPPVFADSARLSDVLRTLLRNAARYSPHGCHPIHLAARPLSTHGQLEFAVRDQGPRIVARYRERIFEPLVELPRYLNRPRRGLGLGLYVAREFARRMKGDLWLRRTARSARSAVEQRLPGNVFVLRIPLHAKEGADA
jgi:signal transduction histidine kinase